MFSLNQMITRRLPKWGDVGNPPFHVWPNSEPHAPTWDTASEQRIPLLRPAVKSRPLLFRAILSICLFLRTQPQVRATVSQTPSSGLLGVRLWPSSKHWASFAVLPHTGLQNDVQFWTDPNSLIPSFANLCVCSVRSTISQHLPCVGCCSIGVGFSNEPYRPSNSCGSYTEETTVNRPQEHGRRSDLTSIPGTCPYRSPVPLSLASGPMIQWDNISSSTPAISPSLSGYLIAFLTRLLRYSNKLQGFCVPVYSLRGI